MTDREKILRDGIRKTIQLFLDLHEHPSYLDEATYILGSAIKQADEIKDGPIEEDIESHQAKENNIKIMLSIWSHWDSGKRISNDDVEFLFSELKKYMGIE